MPDGSFWLDWPTHENDIIGEGGLESPPGGSRRRSCRSELGALSQHERVHNIARKVAHRAPYLHELQQDLHRAQVEAFPPHLEEHARMSNLAKRMAQLIVHGETPYNADRHSPGCTKPTEPRPMTSTYARTATC